MDTTHKQPFGAIASRGVVGDPSRHRQPANASTANSRISSTYTRRWLDGVGLDGVCLEFPEKPTILGGCGHSRERSLGDSDNKTLCVFFGTDRGD